ncbi:hypothetical protein QYB59_001744 [Clostridium perfringens]|nr:hypothetical protein [Clostridium perfringens]
MNKNENSKRKNKLKNILSNIPFVIFNFLLFLVSIGFFFGYIIGIFKYNFEPSFVVKGKWILPLSFTIFLLWLITFISIINDDYDNEPNESLRKNKTYKKKRNFTGNGQEKQRKLTRKERARIGYKPSKDLISDTNFSILMIMFLFNTLFPMILKLYYDYETFTISYLDVVFFSFIVFNTLSLIFLILSKKLYIFLTFYKALSMSILSLCSFLFSLRILYISVLSSRFISLLIIFSSIYLLIIILAFKHLIKPARIIYPKVVLFKLLLGLLSFLVIIYLIELPPDESSMDAIMLLVFSYCFALFYAFFYKAYKEFKHRPRNPKAKK